MTVTEQGHELLALARKGGDLHFNPASGICLIVRDTCWYATGLLYDANGSRRALGNRLLASLHSEDATHTPASMIAILKAAPKSLKRATANSLRKQIRGQIVHAAETEWKDGNVNHPLGAYCTLICGGEMFGETWAPELGARRLLRLLDRVGGHRSRHLRQAEMSEYNSLTYAALSICFLSLIAEYAAHAEAKRAALQLEQGLWLDAAMHFHAPSHQFAGPHSRSYQEDSMGGFSALHGVFVAAGLGPLFMNPDLSLRFDHPSDFLQCALTAITPFHVPDRAREIAWHKPFPYAFRKVTYGESYHENSRRPADTLPGAKPDVSSEPPFAFDEEVYPGGWTDLTTYMTTEYALGSAARPYVNAGHTDSVMLRVRRSASIQQVTDFRSMYTRGVYNGALPGRKNFCHTTESEVDASYLYEEGRCLTYQHENRLIACYSPKRAGHLGVTSFGIDLLFTGFAPFDEVFVGGTQANQLPLVLPAPALICLRDYHTYIILHILAPNPASAPQPIVLRQVGDFYILSISNYDGEKTDFSRDEVNQWRSGFVLEVRTAEEFGSWEAFLSHAKNTSTAEQCDERGVRTVVYHSDGDRMEFRCDPFRETILYRRWNGGDDSITHFEASAAGDTRGRFSPKLLFGNEAIE
jgi:hypothetical protein